MTYTIEEVRTITRYLVDAKRNGWQLRPAQATEAMSRAAIKATPPQMVTSGPEDAFQMAWRAMSNAAPRYKPKDNQ